MKKLDQITALVNASGNKELATWWHQFTACCTKMRSAQRAFSHGRSSSDKERAEKFERWFDAALEDHKGLF